MDYSNSNICRILIYNY